MRVYNQWVRRWVPGLGVVLGSLLLLGCAGQSRAVGDFGASGTETSGRGAVAPNDPGLLHMAVPFFPDDTDQCGPATLASVLTYWGIPTNPWTLKEEIYLPRLKGTLPIDLVLAAQSRGLKAEIYQGSLDNLQSELAQGHPVVALLDLGFAIFPQGHYVVVTGYDDQRRGVYVHSSLDKDVFVSYERFLPGWDKTGRWTLLVTPSERRLRSRA